MFITKEVPFYENTEDDTHCVQACYRMVLKYFEPDIEFSWKELDQNTGKEPNKWTWEMTGLTWLANRGYQVMYIEEFDYHKFKLDGYGYLLEKFGKEIADAQNSHSSIALEQQKVDEFLEQVTVSNVKPEIETVKKYLNNGNLVIVSINYRTLYGKDGYVGHSVLLTGYDDHGFIMHDPGRPGRKHMSVAYDVFLRCWSYPNDTANNITAIKK